MKNTTKKIIALLLAVLMIGMFASCSTTTGKGAIEVTDSMGNIIKLDKPAEKIISLLPSDTETLYALGAQDKIIAVAKICTYPAEVSQKTQLDTAEKTNVETIIAMDPDVVLMGKMSQTKDQADQMANAGIKVIITEPQSIDDIYAMTTLIGKIVNKTKAADKLNATMKKGFSDLSNNAISVAKKSVYIEISPLEFTLWTTGADTFYNEILELLEMTNSFADLTSWSSVSEEQVISRNPDVIVTTMGTTPTEGEASIAEILGRTNWKNMSAIKNKKVFWIDSNKFSIPGPRLVESAQELLDILKK